MRIKRMQCPECGVAVEGDFDAGPLAGLSPEQLAFVEVFLRVRGKIKDVEEELGISYPTVVGRLNELLIALGYEQEPGIDATAKQRERIIDDLAAGRLSAAEATARLRTLAGGDGG